MSKPDTSLPATSGLQTLEAPLALLRHLSNGGLIQSNRHSLAPGLWEACWVEKVRALWIWRSDLSVQGFLKGWTWKKAVRSAVCPQVPLWVWLCGAPTPNHSTALPRQPPHHHHHHVAMPWRKASVNLISLNKMILFTVLACTAFIQALNIPNSSFTLGLKMVKSHPD